jgi:hypothetical protein
MEEDDRGEGTTMKPSTPKGYRPRHIRRWLRANPDIPAFMLVCSCGHWFTEIDDLAPWHWEKCRCKACGDGYTKGTK